MNTSRNNRSLRKKAIPHYFQKSHSSLSDILKSASYKRRIKELLKNNKSLAVTLQDAKYKAANQQKEIEEYARTTQQISHAQLKLKDMACTIQKLVCDLEEVRGFLDVNSFNLMKNVDSSDHRLKIQVPDHSTIEESASRSILEADLSVAEGVTGKGSPSAVSHANSPFSRDDSMTEIYDHRTALARVGSVLKGCMVKSPEDKNVKDQITDSSASISVQSQPKSQLDISKNKLPGKLEAILQNYKESTRKPLHALNTTPLVKNNAGIFVSKIPKVSKPQPPQQDENVQPIELLNNASHRRETFVVKKPCTIPDVFTTAADRRGTFTISNFSEDSKCQKDRRGTYLVPPELVPPIQEELAPPIQEESVPPLQEELGPTNNFTETAFSSENAIPNKTILLCEDMELTEIIPPHKPWNELTEMTNEIPCEKKKETVPLLADEDVEFTEVVPILKLPFQKPQLQAKIIDKGKVVVDKTVSPKENAPAISSPLEDDCFLKPATPKSSHTPLSISSNSTASSELKRNQCAIGKTDSTDDQMVLSTKSSAKRKKSHDIELPDLTIKETQKGRASSMSKRKSVARKGSGKVSDVKSKGTSRKSIAKTSVKKPLVQMDFEVDFCSDIEDELPSDISLSSSSSPSKRRTRERSSFNYEKFFADTSITEPANKNAPIGRRVIDFFETRQSLLPNKRTFIFTNTSKKVNSVTTSASNSQTAGNAPNIELEKEGDDKDVFEFSASDSECTSSKNKHKKAKKRTKRSSSASSSRSAKDNLNKKPRSEKVPQQQIEENSESTTSKSKIHTIKSTSSDSTDDSFVIGDKVHEEKKMNELVNSKGERIFTESSRKTLSRNCKKQSTENINGKTSSSENISNAVSNVFKDDSPCELTSSPIDQDKKKCLSLDKYSPVTDSEVFGKDSCEGLSSKSSEVSEGKRKAKRTFSGVSERRSKKKSTLDPPDFLEEFNSSTILEETLPKTAQLNSNVLALDCDATEVYNFKDIMQAKVQEKNEEQTSDVNKIQQRKGLIEKSDTIRIVKTKDAISDDDALAPTLSKTKKPMKDSNKEKVPPVKQNRNEENSKKAKLPSTEILTSSSLIDKSKKVFTFDNQEQVIEGNEMKHGEFVMNEVSQSKRPKKDSNKEKAPLVKLNENEENSKKVTLPKAETLSSSSTIEKSKNVKHVESVIREEKQSKKPMKDSNKEKAPFVEENEIEENSKKVALPKSKTLSSSSTIEKSKSKKPLKDSNKEKAPLVKQDENEENSKKVTLPKSETISSSSTVEKRKHVESVISEVVRNELPKDVLCNTEVIAPSLHSNKYKKALKEASQDQLTAATEKHREDPTKKLKQSKQKQVTAAIEKQDPTKKLKSMQSTSNDEEATVQYPSTDKNSSSPQNPVPIFNRADFKTTHLDDLTNNDFVQPKLKKLLTVKKDTQNKEDGALIKEKRPKSKKPREEKSNSGELKANLKAPVSVEAQLEPKSSKGAQNFEEVYPVTVSDSVPIHRQNCSGSIDSLSNVDSKDYEGRPSRRNRAAKSYKEPSLNVKMRR